MQHKNILHNWNAKLHYWTHTSVNKKFVIGEIKFQFAKITEFVTSAPKTYTFKYVLPNDEHKEKITCNGVSKNNMKFKNPFNQKGA